MEQNEAIIVAAVFSVDCVRYARREETIQHPRRCPCLSTGMIPMHISFWSRLTFNSIKSPSQKNMSSKPKPI